jgi:hypothetical protein
MYDPKTARFLQEDTYTWDRNDPLSLNLYVYCANNPIAYYDPDGHFFREIRNGFNWLKKKITGNSKQTTSEATISEYEPDWADKADDFLENTGDKIKAGIIGFADKFGGEALDKAATRVLFNDWTSDYSNTPDNWKPALTEAAKKKEHNEMLRDQLGKSYNWTPDKSIEIAYNAGGIAGQVTQAITIGKVLSAAGVGGQLATWGQKAKLFASTGAISGAVNAYGEGKDTAGIIQESAITGAVSVPLGFAGEYVGNKVGSLIQKSAPSVKNLVGNMFDRTETGIISRLNYRPTSGVELISTPRKTTTILGTYAKDTGSIVDELGNVKSTNFGARQDGFNVLNVPDELYQNPAQFWNEYNQPWLNNAITRNDTILMATKPEFKIGSLFRKNSSGKLELSGFGKEYSYLCKNGYMFDSNLNQMIKK